jgi:hypothetical protein
MNSSGPISLGGATTGQSINLEVGAPATSTVSLNDVIVRQLAGVVSGQIVVPTDFYGKSLASGWFAQFTSTSPTGNYQPFISAVEQSTSNIWVVNYLAPAYQSNFWTKISGDDGSVISNYTYSFTSPSIFSANCNLSTVKESNYYPTRMLVSFNQQNGAPGGGSSSGPLIGYINKSDGSVVSTAPARYFGITPAQVAGGTGLNSLVDAPNGNIFFSYSTPPGSGTNILVNSSFSFLQQSGVIGNAANSVFRAANNLELYSGNTIDYVFGETTPSPALLGRLMQGKYNMSTSSYSDVTLRGPMGVAIGTNSGLVGGLSPTSRIAANTGGTGPASPPITAPRNIWKLNRATGNIDVARTTPATGRLSQIANISTNVNSSADMYIAILNGGVLRLHKFDSSLNNTATWDVTGSAGVGISAGYFRGDYLYLQLVFTYSLPAKFWILKIKSDFTTIASGLTATVGGFTITLTPNNAQNITSYDAPFTSPATPKGTGPAPGFTNVPAMSISIAPNPVTFSGIKTTV